MTSFGNLNMKFLSIMITLELTSNLNFRINKMNMSFFLTLGPGSILFYTMFWSFHSPIDEEM